MSSYIVNPHFESSDQPWTQMIHNQGSGPQRRSRFWLCRWRGHRIAPVDLMWQECRDGYKWERQVRHGAASGCKRCRMLHPFDLTVSGPGTVYVDSVTAVFP